jgi:hypothetical protein
MLKGLNLADDDGDDCDDDDDYDERHKTDSAYL